MKSRQQIGETKVIQSALTLTSTPAPMAAVRESQTAVADFRPKRHPLGRRKAAYGYETKATTDIGGQSRRMARSIRRGRVSRMMAPLSPEQGTLRGMACKVISGAFANATGPRTSPRSNSFDGWNPRHSVRVRSMLWRRVGHALQA